MRATTRAIESTELRRFTVRRTNKLFQRVNKIGGEQHQKHQQDQQHQHDKGCKVSVYSSAIQAAWIFFHYPLVPQSIQKVSIGFPTWLWWFDAMQRALYDTDHLNHFGSDLLVLCLWEYATSYASVQVVSRIWTNWTPVMPGCKHQILPTGWLV